MPDSLPVELNNSTIQVHGARLHNLKNVSLEIPRNQLVVITGVSGSGKSSLALDTLHAEGQRKYFQTLSLGVRKRLPVFPETEVDSITGRPVLNDKVRFRYAESHEPPVLPLALAKPRLCAASLLARPVKCDSCFAKSRGPQVQPLGRAVQDIMSAPW